MKIRTIRTTIITLIIMLSILVTSMSILANAPEEIFVPTMEWAVVPTSKDDIIIREGRIMVPVREVAQRFQMGLNVNASAKMLTVTLINVEHIIIFQAGSSTAILDGKKIQLGVAPTLVKGRTYVPFRFLAEALGYTLDKRGMNAYISFTNPYVAGQLGNEMYWMDKSNGDFYYSNGVTKPARIGKLNMQIIDWGSGGFGVKKVGKDILLISMMDVYGEPHLHDVIYQALLQDNRVLIEAKSDYYGFLPHNNVTTYQGNLVMIDGSVAKLVNPDNGKVVQSYDMGALTEGDPQDKYVLEYISDDLLLIRPYSSSLLTLVNLATKQRTVLYKEILTVGSQKILEGWPLGGDYPGDQLRFIKRIDNEFVFEFTDRFNGGNKTTYNYKVDFDGK